MSSSNINSKINIKNINNNSKENNIRVMEATTAPITNKNRLVKTTTASVTTITIAVAKKTTSTVVTSTARPGRQHLLSEIVW